MVFSKDTSEVQPWRARQVHFALCHYTCLHVSEVTLYICDQPKSHTLQHLPAYCEFPQVRWSVQARWNVWARTQFSALTFTSQNGNGPHIGLDAQRGYVAYLRLHSQQKRELHFNPGSYASRKSVFHLEYYTASLRAQSSDLHVVRAQQSCSVAALLFFCHCLPITESRPELLPSSPWKHCSHC